jgi:predicted alpha/beta-hydrolase family hydrolase
VADRIAFEWEGGALSGAWHRAGGATTCVLLAHGAGGNLHTPGLVTYAEALASRGVDAVRFNFPYAEAQRKAPDPQRRLVSSYRAVAEQVRAKVAGFYLGGRSMGGRIASHVVADGFPARGLVFLAYPLHPPGQPERLRDAHLKTISVPMLFLQGSRDAFARPELLSKTIASLPRATLHIVDGADHGLTVKGRSSGDVIAELVEATTSWMR